MIIYDIYIYVYIRIYLYVINMLVNAAFANPPLGSCIQSSDPQRQTREATVPGWLALRNPDANLGDVQEKPRPRRPQIHRRC